MSENDAFEPAGSDIVADHIDDGIVVVNLVTGSYFTLDGTAREAWDLLAAGRPRGEVVTMLALRYGAERLEVARSLDTFIDRLRDEGLLAPSRSTGPRNASLAAPAPVTGPFAPPVLVKYTDMEDLLNLDPIHEVDDSGWPVARAPEGR